MSVMRATSCRPPGSSRARIDSNDIQLCWNALVLTKTISTRRNMFLALSFIHNESY